MKPIKVGTVIASFFGIFLAATSAMADTCQSGSDEFFERLYCGLEQRGYAEGITVFGQKSLVAENTSGSNLTTVRAVGVAADGTLISNCAAQDEVWDHQPAIVVGGSCLSAVRFKMQINYY